MKKFFIPVMVLLLLNAKKSDAQFYDINYYNLSKTEQVFNVNNSYFLRHKFYISLTKGNYISIEVNGKNALERLMNMDSIIAQLQKNIDLIKDSLWNPLSNKKIDLSVKSDGTTKMRFKETMPQGSSFLVKGNELTALKIDQDTIQLIGYIKTPVAERLSTRGIYYQQPFRIFIVLNNISDLQEYTEGMINQTMKQLKTDWEKNTKWSEKNNWKTKLYGYYYAYGGKNISVKKMPRNNQWLPYLQFGVQNIQSVFGPSAAVGLELSQRFINDENSIRKYQLIWESFFFFEKDITNKTNLLRNDFITFQYRSERHISIKLNNIGFKIFEQFSIGYIVNRNGEYFEKNTIKLGLPGFQFKNLILNPEFISMNNFKKTYPSLKLSLYIE